MKILFIAPGDILKARVEPLLWIRMCEAFVKNKIETRIVSLNVKRPDNISRGHIWTYYGVKKSHLRSTILPTPLRHISSTLYTNIIGVTAHALYALYVFVTRTKYDYIYTKKYSFLLPYIYFKRLLNSPKLAMEIHAMPKNQKAIPILRKVDGIIVNSKILKHDLIDSIGLSPDKIFVSYLGPHSLTTFKRITRESALKKAHLSHLIDKQIVVYCGKIIIEEMEVVLRSAKILSNKMHFVIVGGNPKVLTHFNNRLNELHIDNVLFTGFKAPTEISTFLQLADILLVNYCVRSTGLHKYMTPGKVFDYLPMGKPIISAHFEALDEILTDKENAFLFEAGNPDSLAKSIKFVLDNKELAKKVAERAKLDSKKFTWDYRAKHILAFLSSLK